MAFGHRIPSSEGHARRFFFVGVCVSGVRSSAQWCINASPELAAAFGLEVCEWDPLTVIYRGGEMNLVYISDATYSYLRERDCFLVDVEVDQPLDVQLDRAKALLAAALNERAHREASAALIMAGSRL